MGLVEGPIFQICWVVDDIDAAETWFTENFGVPAWTRFSDLRFDPDTCSYRGKPADYSIHISLGYAGEQQLELIQPISGESLYSEHITRCGPGLHHVAWIPDDFDATIAQAEAGGIEITQRGTFGGMDYAYLDCSAGGAPHVELMKLTPEMRTFFDTLRDAHR